MRYFVQRLLLASTTQTLPLTSFIVLSRVRVSDVSVIDTLVLRDLIALREDLALFVTLLPLVCMTFRWRLDTSALTWSTTVMHPILLESKNESRVEAIPPALSTRTDDDRSLHCTNKSNPSDSRIWWYYQGIWLVWSLSLL